MKLATVAGKRIVGIVRGSMSSHNRMRPHDTALVLEDKRGRRSYLSWTVIEETDGAFYGVELIYPARAPRREFGETERSISSAWGAPDFAEDRALRLRKGET